jgi:hypothetical protein
MVMIKRLKEYEKLKYKTNISSSDSVNDGLDWCLNNLGERWCPIEKRSNKWSCSWMGWHNDQSVYQFSFAEEKDFMMFKLKFS